MLLVTGLTSCDDERLDPLPEPDQPCEIREGDPVLLSMRLPQAQLTRAKSPAEEAYDALIGTYRPVEADYDITVEMLEKGQPAPVAVSHFYPAKTSETTYDAFGTLLETTSTDTLRWASNVKPYGFHAYAGTATLEANQSTSKLLFAQDRIEGYGFVPGWDEKANNGAGASVLDINDVNYLTSREWYAANKARAAAMGGMSLDPSFLKKIPLYMRHQRAKITVRLQAGEGVEPAQLAYTEQTAHNIIAKIFSYDAGNNPTEITPCLSSYDCDYTPDVADDPQNTIKTACYEAIVTPHDYAEGDNLGEQKIVSINLSGLNFSYHAINDQKYHDYQQGDADALADLMQRYRLEAGKHLILTVILSTDTRKILITAYVVDWEDYAFSSICDDFGQAGKPIEIKSRQDLIDFMTDPKKNKPGNVGLVTPLTLRLCTSDLSWDVAERFELKAMLKLAGATIVTDRRLFQSISASGSIVGGSVMMVDRTTGDGQYTSAVADWNYGTIDRVIVSDSASLRSATRGGLVVTNYGSITRCTSYLRVKSPDCASLTYVGGIAAEMQYPRMTNGVIDHATLPLIDQCHVDARIDGGANVVGGGIVGLAEGQLSNNVFEYGITLGQPSAAFKNIVHTRGSEGLTSSGNEWPTKDENGNGIDNLRQPRLLYEHVLDSQMELKLLLTTSQYNVQGQRVRVAGSFTVDDTWTLGHRPANDAPAFDSECGNLLCELDGNNKTITLTSRTDGVSAPMLFSLIASTLSDLTVVVDKPIFSLPSTENVLPARAPLGYAVCSAKGRLDGIRVKMREGSYIEATSPGGLVVWAYDGAVIENCYSDAEVRVAIPDGSGSQQTYFVGGLVCEAAEATIQSCTYYGRSVTLPTGLAPTVYVGGIVGGTDRKSADGAGNPSLLINDCTSWLNWSDEWPTWGGIIGCTKYAKTGFDMPNGMREGCAGNWWTASAGASATGLAIGMTEERAIGRKNAVTPMFDNNYSIR